MRNEAKEKEEGWQRRWKEEGSRARPTKGKTAGSTQQPCQESDKVAVFPALSIFFILSF
jgi:hypothetical protein